MKTFRSVILIFLIIFFTSIITIALYSMYSGIEINYTSDYDVEKISKMVEEKQKEDSNIQKLLENATESIVGISKLQDVGNSIFVEDAEKKLGLGSGIIVSKDGYIITNEHVSGERLSTCYITLKNGKGYKGEVVWTDKDLDLSIVKISAKGLNEMKMGDSDNLMLADSVYAIGNPIGFEFQRTVTAGIISGLNRTIKLSDGEYTFMEDLIQTDATINQGNSGGALIDGYGKLIGINTVKITSADGMGFAVPINTVKPIIKKLIEKGKFEEAYLGIYGYDKNVIPYLDEQLNFESGIYVAQVVLDGPCYGAGILEGDIITSVDSKNINSMAELKKYIYSKEPDDFVELNILRNHSNFTIKVKLSRKF